MTQIPLANQIIEIEKHIRDCGRRYQELVDKGRWKQETADRKRAALRAVQSTLVWLEKNHDWIKAEAERRRAEARAKAKREAELAEIESDPGVAAALAAFPGAEPVDIRPLDAAVEPEEDASV